MLIQSTQAINGSCSYFEELLVNNNNDMLLEIFKNLDCSQAFLKSVCKKWNIFVTKIFDDRHVNSKFNDNFLCAVDRQKSKIVCFQCYHTLSTIELITDIKQNDKKLWKEIVNLKKHIKNGKIEYIDRHLDYNNGGNRCSIETALIVQSYANKEPSDSWICPFYCRSTQYKNQWIDLDDDKANQISLTTDFIGHGIMISKQDISELNKDGVSFQKGFDSIERNIKMTVEDILRLIP